MRTRNLSHQFVSATVWNTVLFPARLIVGLVASVVYYQRLSLDQVGILFLLQSIATTIGMYADLGIERALPRFFPEAELAGGREGVKGLLLRVIRLKLVILLAVVGALAAGAGPITRALVGQQLHEIQQLEQGRGVGPAGAASAAQAKVAAKRSVVGELRSRGGMLLAAVGLLLLFGALFDVYMQFLTAYLKQRSWNLITLTSTLLQPLLVTTFILLGWGMAGVLLGLVLTPGVSLLLAGWQVSRASSELPSTGAVVTLDSRFNRRFAGFAAVNYLMQITTWVYDLQFVVFLSAATLGIADVALLGFAYKFAKDFLAYVWTPLTGVMTPVLSRVHVRGEPRALREAHAALTRIIWLVVLPAGVGLCVLTPGILATLYPKYEGTGALIVVFIAFTFGETLLSVPQNVLMVAEVYRPVILARMVAFLTVPLVWFLLPRYGVMGVAIAAGSARLLSRALTLGVGLRRFQLDFPWAFAARVVSASVAMGGAVAVALGEGFGPRPGYGRLISIGALGLWSLVGAAVFVVALKAVGGLHPDDRRRLADLPVPWARLLAKAL